MVWRSDLQERHNAKAVAHEHRPHIPANRVQLLAITITSTPPLSQRSTASKMTKDEVSDEAKALVTSDINLYELLGIEPTADAKALKSAWRKTSLKYHPDKNQDNPSAVEKFYLAKNAVELLSDPTLRAQYDNGREARAQKERANALLDAKRRQMVADLEAGERGAKRKRAEEADAEERLQRELKRLAQDGERRRREREELKAREREEEARRDYEREMRRKSGVHVQPNGTSTTTPSTGTPSKPKRPFDVGSGSQSAPSTPANSKGNKAPAFSFSPKTPGGSSKFEQDTLARLKARQAEKKKLEEQIRQQEAEKAQGAAAS
ncbi:hypothetical protein IWZ00DRAFT_573971 [Phyllosticta capitalensis]